MKENKKLIVIFLFLSLLVFSGNLSAKKRKYGVNLEIFKNDGQIIKGELIAVKQSSLLLLGYESSRDITVNIRNINKVKILKKIKIGSGISTGFLVGVASGAALGFSADEDQLAWATISAGFFGAVGASVGILGSLIAAAPETIQFMGMSELELENNLCKLRSKSRFPDYR